MAKSKKPALNRPDLDDEPLPQVSVITQADRDEIEANRETHIDPVFVEPPEPGEVIDGIIEALRNRVRVPAGAGSVEILQAVLGATS